MTIDRSAERILIVAPIGRDAELMCTYLTRADMTCHARADMEEVAAELQNGAGALIFTDEALHPDQMARLSKVLYEQPPWSEVPIIILTGLPTIEARTRSFRELGRRTNITLVDRPVRITSLISAAQSALKARQRQYEVRDLMRKLEDRVHERDRFLAILGHELRNPLSAILLAAQMTDTDAKLDAEHVKLIERQSRHLSQLVNDLLDLSRVISGKIVLKKQVINMREVLQQCLQTLRDSKVAKDLTIELREQTTALHVFADPLRVEQIVSNVLTNAVKYTPEGGHVIVTMGREGGNAFVRITDDGIGIARERLGSIFELFAQAENAIGRAQGGMGIGLALVRNLVELHGGSVAVCSDGIGHGSDFTIRLPLAVDAVKPAEPVATAPRAAPLPAHSIMIVEDNHDVRELLRVRLRKLGHTVDAAGDGPEGVRRILQTRPDLALVDIGLPGFDGYEVAQRVRAELGDRIVLIAVSGFGQPEDKRRAAESGFDAHVTKPADTRDIEEIMRQFSSRTTAPTDSVAG